MDNLNIGAPMPPQAQPPIKPLLNKGVIIGLSAAIVILFAAVIYLLTSKPANGPEVVGNNQANQNQQVKNQDEIENWKTYTNTSLGFFVQYPVSFAPTVELNDQYNRLTAFGASKTDTRFEVRLYKDTDPDMGVKYGFLGAEIASTKVKLGDIIGFQAVSATGYGDAGAQGNPYVEFAARHNGNVYHLIFYGDAIVSVEENKILSTFKFTTQDEISAWKTYRNEKYGFELQLTDAWKGYQVKLAEVSSNFGAGSLLFCVPSTAPIQTDNGCDKGYSKIMVVSIMSQEQWDFSEKQEGPKPGFLGRNTNYVFGYSFWQDPPNDLISKNFETDKAIASFRPF